MSTQDRYAQLDNIPLDIPDRYARFDDIPLETQDQYAQFDDIPLDTQESRSSKESEGPGFPSSLWWWLKNCLWGCF